MHLDAAQSNVEINLHARWAKLGMPMGMPVLACVCSKAPLVALLAFFLANGSFAVKYSLQCTHAL